MENKSILLLLLFLFWLFCRQRIALCVIILMCDTETELALFWALLLLVCVCVWEKMHYLLYFFSVCARACAQALTYHCLKENAYVAPGYLSV